MTQPTEHALLTRYLLLPSTLPSILPYSTFLTLVPSSLRTPANAPLLKRLYRDLQEQRDIDVQMVALNVRRECERGVVLGARVRREVGEEMGMTDSNGNAAEAQTNGDRKRKRSDEDDEEVSNEGSRSDDSADYDASEPSDPPPPHGTTKGLPETKSLRPNTDPDAPINAHLDTLFTGPRGLARPLDPPEATNKYHTPTSLLSAMSTAVSDLEGEIQRLETRNANLLEEMRGVVGDMSDLRYGKLPRRSGVDDEDGAEKEVTDALKQLREGIGRKLTETDKGKSKAGAKAKVPVRRFNADG
jgi:hypothetical protein